MAHKEAPDAPAPVGKDPAENSAKKLKGEREFPDGVHPCIKLGKERAVVCLENKSVRFTEGTQVEVRVEGVDARWLARGRYVSEHRLLVVLKWDGSRLGFKLDEPTTGYLTVVTTDPPSEQVTPVAFIDDEEDDEPSGTAP